MSTRDKYGQVAGSVPFDNDNNGFTSDDVQGALEEINQTVLTSASPGFSFGRSGNLAAGSYLQNESVPSNKSGRWVYINSAEVAKVFVSNELVTTFTLDILEHEGNEINLTLLGSITVTAARGGAFAVSWPATTDRQLCVRVSPLSANNPKNVVCGLELRGTN